MVYDVLVLTPDGKRCPHNVFLSTPPSARIPLFSNIQSKTLTTLYKMPPPT